MKRDSSFRILENRLSKPFCSPDTKIYAALLTIIGAIFSFLGIVLLSFETSSVGIIATAFGAVCFSGTVLINCFGYYQMGFCPYCHKSIKIQRAKKRFKCPYCKRPILKKKTSIENAEPIINILEQEIGDCIQPFPESTEPIAYTSEQRSSDNVQLAIAETTVSKAAEPQNPPKPDRPKLCLSYMRDDFFGEWEWKSQCNSEQRIRLERAKTSTIYYLFKIDYERGTAYCHSSKFESTGEVYEVTYKSCTCRDFRYRFYPCKHIYALNLRLGIISRDEELDGVPQSIKDKICLLEPSGVARFKKILLEHKTKLSVPFPLKTTKLNKMLLDAGLLVESGSETRKLLDIVFTRNDLVAKIYENGLEYKPKSKDKKEEIINYIVDNEPGFAKKIIKNNVMVSFSEEILDNFSAVFNYYTK